MKKIFALLLLLSLCAGPAGAQSLMIGERMPDLPAMEWLDGRMPRRRPFTVIEFFDSSNEACIRSLEYTHRLTRKYDTKLHAIVVMRPDDEAGAKLAEEYLGEGVSIGVDTRYEAFAACGVCFVPFTVLVDGRQRVIWMGETRRLDEAEFQRLYHNRYGFYENKPLRKRVHRRAPR